MTDKRRYFESLDLLRGLAAIVVLIYHADFMFGLRHRLFPGGYLAVDLFFVLSGFVLSLNYGDKFLQRSISFRDYLVARLARLYPLFFVTTAIGCVVMTVRYRSNYGYVDGAGLTSSALTNILMLPSFAGAYDTTVLFIFNPASWSIFFEMVASILIFCFLGRISQTALVAVAAVAAVALAGATLFVGTVDTGYSSENIWAGFPRVIFSFTVGMLIQNAFTRKPWRCTALSYYAMLAAVLALIQLKMFFPNAPLFDILAVGFVLPALVAVGAGVSFAGLPRKIALFFGETSYSVYLTQGSLIIIAAGLSQALMHEKIYDLGAWVGFVFIPFAVALSFLTYRYFELPSRVLLRQLAASQTVRADARPPRL
jgi:peptidoglycan/LPS O-acetylase OafA/YrhL